MPKKMKNKNQTKENWEWELLELWKEIWKSKKGYRDLEYFICRLLKSEKAKDCQEIIEKIDKIYKKEQGIHNWLDLREKLKEEIKKVDKTKE